LQTIHAFMILSLHIV